MPSASPTIEPGADHPFDRLSVDAVEAASPGPGSAPGTPGAPERSAEHVQDLLEMACRTARLGIFERDLVSGAAAWNRELFEFRGVPFAEHPPPFEAAASNVFPADRPQFDAAMRGSLLPRRDPVRRQSYSLRYRVQLGDGSVRHLHKQWVVYYGADGQARRLLGVVADETPHMALLQSRGLALAQLDMASDLTGLACWRHDLASDSVQLNARACELLGIATGQPVVPGQRLRLALHPDDLAAADAADAQAAGSRRPVDVEVRCRNQAGAWSQLMTRRGAQTDDAGRTVALVGVAIEVADRGAVDPAGVHGAAAQRDSRTSSLLLARLSHELRTPMNAVLGFAHLLSYEDSKDQQTSPARRRAVDHITQAGQHLMALIDDVLDLSRLEGGEMQLALRPVALDEVVASVLAMLDADVRQREAVVRTHGLHTRVLGDAMRLRQVLLNLLSNALKYGRNGGTVTVSAQVQPQGVLLQVDDEGRGVSEQQLRHLFEPFNRLGAERTRTEGTGLGLSIAKALVERMGGSVRVHSHPGIGSRFELMLLAAPVDDGASASGDAAGG